MSLLGFDAIGRLALGQITTNIGFVLSANAGSYASTGAAATFRITENAAAGSYSLTGFPSSYNFGLLTGAYVITGGASPGFSLSVSSGSISVTGYPAVLSRDFVNWLPSQALPAAGWATKAGPSSAWTPAALPSQTWTVDPVMTIPAPVTG
jgi:hypothetical protein